MIRTLRRLLPMPTIYGYTDARICERVAEKTMAYNPSPPYLDIGGAKRILDFGGGCGVHYKQALAAGMDCDWVVVETPAMIRAAMKYTQPRNLAFVSAIEDAKVWLGGPPDLIYSNGALQYCYDPIRTLDKLCALNASRMLWERTDIRDGASGYYMERSFLSDHGPGELCGSEAEVITKVRPICTSLFLNAHWRYNHTHEGDRWVFTRRQV